MRFTIDFSKQIIKGRTALTLDPKVKGYNHKTGWTINGEIVTDYYSWINYFEASHPKYGWVKGDFEKFIEAKSKIAYTNFRKFYNPESWDYNDI